MTSDGRAARGSKGGEVEPEVDRYSRQRLFQPIGSAGQEMLARARVALVGCGALGSHLAQHLARAGVGFLRLVDRDFVTLDNLQRQVLFDEDDARRRLPKAVAAAAHLSVINSEVEVEPCVADLHADTVRELLAGCTLVVDGTDNFQTRLVLNDACVALDLPWVYGGVVAAHGMVLAVRPGVTACFACLVPEAPAPGTTPTCDTAGVLGPAVGVVASIQAAEAMKMLTGRTEALLSGLLTVDLWHHEYRVLAIARDPHCRACGVRRLDYLESRAAAGTTTILCGRNAVQVSPPPGTAPLDLGVLGTRLAALGAVRANEHLLCFAQEGLEATLFRDGRAFIQGTDDASVARAFYARYVGS